NVLVRKYFVQALDRGKVVCQLRMQKRSTILRLSGSRRRNGVRMSLLPHDHRMWAVIGLYGGKEDNTFYQRSPKGLLRSGGKELSVKEACPLGAAVIHSVINPLDKITAAIHVYGGDYFGVPRSQWDAETLEEQPFDIDYIMGIFEESNRALEDKGGIAHR
ncbi:MAG: hypothetical protein O6837_03830, partial [Deltaproteobacteria bacterium]|nr:hypothetical protein [Deltaproteobacteria bacterium]